MKLYRLPVHSILFRQLVFREKVLVRNKIWRNTCHTLSLLIEDLMIFVTDFLLRPAPTNLSGMFTGGGGGSSSGSPATGYMGQHGSSPAPSSTPGSDMSGQHQPASSPGGWDVKPPQQPLHPSSAPHPASAHPATAHHPTPHNYLPQYSWYPTDNPGLLT